MATSKIAEYVRELPQSRMVLETCAEAGFALVLPELPRGQRVAFTTYRKSEDTVVSKRNSGPSAKRSNLKATRR